MMYQSYYHEDGKAYFYGNEVSEYGLKNGYVDYKTLSKAFEAVLSNEIIPATDGVIGYWDQISGRPDFTEERDEIEETITALQEELDGLDDYTDRHGYNPGTAEADRMDEIEEEIDKLRERLDEIEDEENNPPEVFQFYIVSANAVDILTEAGEVVYYNEALDMYIWGVTHYGTAWSYVLTDIKIGSYENWKKWLAGEAEEAA